MRTERWLLCLILLGTGAAAAQPPARDVRLEVLPAQLDLAAALARAEASHDVLWLGWSVAAQPGSGDACCHEGRGGRWDRRVCELEGRGGSRGVFVDSGARPGRVRSELALLMRFVDGRATDLRTVVFDCELDFGDRRLWWLGPVAAEESAARLSAWAASPPAALDSSELLLALSLQAQGTDHLIRLARDRSVDRSVRREAVFWLGHSDDDRAMEFLEATLLRPRSR